METKEQGVNLQIAIRCARALNLLSSLRSHDLKATTNDNEDEETKTTKKEIGDLKLELVRERMKTNKIKVSGLMELALQVAMVLFVYAFLFLIVLIKK